MQKRIQAQAPVLLGVPVLIFGLVIRVEAADYYVNPNPALASDDYDGTKQVYETGTIHGPKRTLKAAMEIPGLKGGDVVHAAQGVYNEGVMAPINSEAVSNRVAVVAGVALVSDEGAEVTIIEGFIPPTDSNSISTNGGPSSVRCVAFSETDNVGYIKGFTLRNGSTCIQGGTGNKKTLYRGGGISYGTAIDCIITNCFAVRGGGAANATLIRSKIVMCGNVYGANAAGGIASTQATASMDCRFYDSYIEGTSTYLHSAVNCHFEGLTQCANGSIGTAVNSYFSVTPAYLTLDCCKVGGGMTLDVYQRPTRSDIIGMGSVAAYIYPEGFESESGKDILGRSRFEDGKIDIGCLQRTFRSFYVDANNGNDAWDGLAATNTAPATSTCGPRKTLAQAMMIDGLGIGDVVKAMPGTYDSGLMFDDDAGVTNRVVVPEGVGLIGVSGAEVTVIKGAASKIGLNGHGLDSVRGAYVKSQGYLKGFTICEGTTPEDGKTMGAGVFLAADAALVNCRVVNNSAGYRSAVAGSGTSVIIGCHIAGNTAVDVMGVGLYDGLAFNCVFGEGGSCYIQHGKIVNCTFAGNCDMVGYRNDPPIIPVYNSLFLSSAPQRAKLYRTLTKATINATSVAYDDTQTGVTEDLTLQAGNYRLADVGALPVGYGDVNHYTTNFPARWKQFADVDYDGGQRVYNGVIDVGAGEYDWRPVFGRILGKGVTVVSATANVTASGKNVKIASGGTMTVDWRCHDAPTRTFVAQIEEPSDDGALTVKTNGVFFARLCSGTQMYWLKVDRNDVRISFEYTGAGSALVSDFTREMGLRIIIR